MQSYPSLPCQCKSQEQPGGNHYCWAKRASPPYLHPLALAELHGVRLLVRSHMSKHVKFTPLRLLSKSRLFPVPSTFFFYLAALPSVVLVLAVFGTRQHSSENMSLTVVINTPWVTASPWNHLMILAQCEQMRWKTSFGLQCYYAMREMGGVVVGQAYVTMCLFPPSPQGAKARRATSMKRENGCGECSNRWDESSVLVRYSLRYFIPWPFLFLAFYYTLLFPSCICHSHLCHFCHRTCHNSLNICQFGFGVFLFLRLLTCSLSFYRAFTLVWKKPRN